MKIYETVKLEVIDLLDDVIRTSGETENTSGGVYEHVSDLSTKNDWF